MAELEKVRNRIREIAGRTRNVALSEIKEVLRELSQHGFTVYSWPAGGHAEIFQVDDETFSICTHHRGSKQLKACYVREFIRVMIKLGMYE
ncbi:MAG: hypothetical protein ABSF98_00065 [Bryobacteraceae bacterium]|jgi:hypothetical protein